ncbi:hypothetical protein [Thermoleptolyngbya sp. M55_K2018_002]|uniref:hypothetical protein n=1 Tax=Thermoleptolyngbya sp. M55_K2018_002 TaxID=2747808 RepID=UPI001A0FE27E|nr:hypothetical protein [Thermoleptolyngbya sp. M55_K2018_002]HIK39458.1 hypothetical protein [Thermoleptolyngbya sp. M55_K2018_002]
MAFAIGLLAFFITLALVQAVVYFPIALVNHLFHWPAWLAIALGVMLFSWLLGEPWDEPF